MTNIELVNKALDKLQTIIWVKGHECIDMSDTPEDVAFLRAVIIALCRKEED